MIERVVKVVKQIKVLDGARAMRST